MRKFYKMTLVALLSLFGMAAQAAEISFTLKVNVPNAVGYELNGDRFVLTEEETVVAATDYYGNGVYMNLYTTEDNYRIRDVKDQYDSSIGYGYGTQYYFSAEADGTYSILVSDVEADRTASFTMNCDDPSKVSLQVGTEQVQLTETSQVIKFDPVYESVAYLNSTQWDVPLYKVSLDGVDVTDPNGYYQIPLTDGCVVDVEANYPDKECIVTFTYGEGAEGCISAVGINGEEVENFDGKTVSAKLGDSFYFGVSSEYNVDEVTINGEPLPYFYGDYTATLFGDMAIHIEAHKYKEIEFTLNIDDPENVIIFTRDQLSWNEVPMTGLVAGDNVISMYENDNTFMFRAAPGCTLISVTDSQGEDFKESGFIYAVEGETYTFVTEKMNLDLTAVIYVDQPDGWTYFSAAYDMENTRTQLNLESGYNIVPFSTVLNPFGFSWYGADYNGIYLNGEAVAPMYEGSNTYEVAPEGNAVIKIYLAAAPKDCAVTFVVAEDAEATVTRDVIDTVEDFKAGFTCFNGTMVSVAGEAIEVALGENKIERGEDGLFTFTVESDTLVNITGATGVGTLGAENADAPVYNLQGLKMATRAAINSLPAGIYIVSGKKVVVK